MKRVNSSSSAVQFLIKYYTGRAVSIGRVPLSSGTAMMNKAGHFLMQQEHTTKRNEIFIEKKL